MTHFESNGSQFGFSEEELSYYQLEQLGGNCPPGAIRLYWMADPNHLCAHPNIGDFIREYAQEDALILVEGMGNVVTRDRLNLPDGIETRSWEHWPDYALARLALDRIYSAAIPRAAVAEAKAEEQPEDPALYEALLRAQEVRRRLENVVRPLDGDPRDKAAIAALRQVVGARQTFMVSGLMHIMHSPLVRSYIADVPHAILCPAKATPAPSDAQLAAYYRLDEMSRKKFKEMRPGNGVVY